MGRAVSEVRGGGVPARGARQLIEPPRVGRPIQIVAGSFFIVCAAVSCIAALIAFSDSFRSTTTGRVAFFAVFTLIGLGCIRLGWRLISGRPRRDGGLLSPLVLRISAGFFILLPIASLATGAWRNNRLPFAVLLAQAVIYLMVGVRLWFLASSRSGRSR